MLLTSLSSDAFRKERLSMNLNLPHENDTYRSILLGMTVTRPFTLVRRRPCLSMNSSVFMDVRPMLDNQEMSVIPFQVLKYNGDGMVLWHDAELQIAGVVCSSSVQSGEVVVVAKSISTLQFLSTDPALCGIAELHLFIIRDDDRTYVLQVFLYALFLLGELFKKLFNRVISYIYKRKRTKTKTKQQQIIPHSFPLFSYNIISLSLIDHWILYCIVFI